MTTKTRYSTLTSAKSVAIVSAALMLGAWSADASGSPGSSAAIPASDDAETDTPRKPKYPKNKTISFPEAERMLTPLMKKWARNLGNKPATLLRQFMLGNDWYIERHKRTGKVLSRSFNAKVYYRGGDSGRCMARDCSVTQEEQGGSWGKPQLYCRQDMEDAKKPKVFDCAAIDKLPGSRP